MTNSPQKKKKKKNPTKPCKVHVLIIEHLRYSCQSHCKLRHVWEQERGIRWLIEGKGAGRMANLGRGRVTESLWNNSYKYITAIHFSLKTSFFRHIRSSSVLLCLSGHGEIAAGSTGEETAAGRGQETRQEEKEKTGVLMRVLQITVQRI